MDFDVIELTDLGPMGARGPMNHFSYIGTMGSNGPPMCAWCQDVGPGGRRRARGGRAAVGGPGPRPPGRRLPGRLTPPPAVRAPWHLGSHRPHGPEGPYGAPGPLWPPGSPGGAAAKNPKYKFEAPGANRAHGAHWAYGAYGPRGPKPEAGRPATGCGTLTLQCNGYRFGPLNRRS